MYYDELGILTRQISAENPTGEKGRACECIPDPDDPDLPFSSGSVHLDSVKRCSQFRGTPPMN